MTKKLTFNNKPKKETKLTTKLGRRLDKLKYWHIIVFAAIIILGGMIYYTYTEYLSSDSKLHKLSWDESLFYSLSSFTGMSVNNITPVGLGRFVVIIQAIAGLFLTALLIGKIASERQAAILRLIYTSQQQNRIDDFKEDIQNWNEELNSVLDDQDHIVIRKKAEQTEYFLSAISSYLNFQSNQGGLAEKGNETTLRRLYLALGEICETLSEAIKLNNIDPSAKEHFEKAMKKLWKIGTMMQQWQNSPITIGLLNNLVTRYEHLLQWLEKESAGNASYTARTQITENLIARVKERMPSKPWPVGIHKDIAEEFRVSNSMISKCIDELEKRN